jgi:hypothetical protein
MLAFQAGETGSIPVTRSTIKNMSHEELKPAGFQQEEESKPKELNPEERQAQIDKKIEAIKKQNQEMSLEEITKQAQNEVDNFVEVWGAINKIGKKWYSIEGESKEKMAEWKKQIAEIKNALGSENFSQLTNIYLDKIPDNIKKESKESGGEYDDEAKTLLSICLWLQRGQVKWAGNRKTFWKVLSKDSVKLSSFLDKKGAPACIDTSYLTKALAEEFDINGEVKKVPINKNKLTPDKMSHFYFRSNTGKIVDYWWGRDRDVGKNTGGLKLNQRAYDKTIEERNGFNICG